MRNFAAGLTKDLAAMRAGLTEEWSNGPVEGVVNKLKLVKRQVLREGRIRAAQGEGGGRLKAARSAVWDGTHRFTKKPTQPMFGTHSGTRDARVVRVSRRVVLP